MSARVIVYRSDRKLRLRTKNVKVYLDKFDSTIITFDRV